jgi:hypothetical protein
VSGLRTTQQRLEAAFGDGKPSNIRASGGLVVRPSLSPLADIRFSLPSLSGDDFPFGRYPVATRASSRGAVRRA